MTAALPVHGADLHRSLPGATHQVPNVAERPRPADRTGTDLPAAHRCSRADPGTLNVPDGRGNC